MFCRLHIDSALYVWTLPRGICTSNFEIDCWCNWWNNASIRIFWFLDCASVPSNWDYKLAGLSFQDKKEKCNCAFIMCLTKWEISPCLCFQGLHISTLVLLKNTRRAIKCCLTIFVVLYSSVTYHCPIGWQN